MLLTGGVGNNKKGCFFSLYSLVEENDGWRKKVKKVEAFQISKLLVQWVLVVVIESKIPPKICIKVDLFLSILSDKNSIVLVFFFCFNGEN